jgi:hypothetical protein
MQQQSSQGSMQLRFSSWWNARLLFWSALHFMSTNCCLCTAGREFSAACAIWNSALAAKSNQSATAHAPLCRSHAATTTLPHTPLHTNSPLLTKLGRTTLAMVQRAQHGRGLHTAALRRAAAGRQRS